MAGFDFSQLDRVVKETSSNRGGKINFLKLQDNGWYAKVRFMYGPGEFFRGETVHNVAPQGSKMPKYVSCIREEGQPVESCPLCKAGIKITPQFFIPVYVQSIVSVINGMEQEQQVGQVMVFQRGTTFTSGIQSVIRQTSTTGKPIVSSLFRLVRNGGANDNKTTYTVEYIGTDDVTLEQLPPRPEVVGSYILPTLTYEEIEAKYLNGGANAHTAQQAAPVMGIAPRQINTNTFAGNTGFAQPQTTSFNQPMNNNANQAPVQAPTIGTGNVPF